MKTSWLNGLNESDTKEMKGLFIEAARLRKRMTVLLEEKIRVQESKVITDAGYSDASWAYRQADAIGYKRAITEVLNLIENSEK